MPLKGTYVKDTLAFILAGGMGERLTPLTFDRAKPAVPFGGIYRIIDFTLSNCINSNLRKIFILSQYKSMSLERHLLLGWNLLNLEMGEFIVPIPPQKRVGDMWYRGTSDAIYQNIYHIAKQQPKRILILSGDHIYKMDYSEMLSTHLKKDAQVTIAAHQIDKKEASELGVLEVDSALSVVGFEEKPANPKPLPFNRHRCFVSMGVYLFNTDFLIDWLKKDAADPASSHDFGRDILPKMAAEEDMFYAFDFNEGNKKATNYWRDVGTIDAYWEANMDLVSVDPEFNLYDPNWPIRTWQGQYPPAKTVFAQKAGKGRRERMGVALDSVISGGCILSGGRVQNSVLSPRVRINSYSTIYQSVLMDQVEVGRYCRIKNTIIDKYVKIPPHTNIGYDLEEDSKKYYVSPKGIVVVPKETVFPSRVP
jgi:glucose-1-phosphate adenylyltransferase